MNLDNIRNAAFNLHTAAQMLRDYAVLIDAGVERPARLHLALNNINAALPEIAGTPEFRLTFEQIHDEVRRAIAAEQKAEATPAPTPPGPGVASLGADPSVLPTDRHPPSLPKSAKPLADWLVTPLTLDEYPDGLAARDQWNRDWHQPRRLAGATYWITVAHEEDDNRKIGHAVVMPSGKAYEVLNGPAYQALTDDDIRDVSFSIAIGLAVICEPPVVSAPAPVATAEVRS